MRPVLLSVLNLWFVFGALAQNQPLIDLNKPDFNSLVHRSHTEKTVALFDYYEKYIFDNDSATVYEDMARVRQLASTHADAELHLVADLMEAHYYAYRYEHQVVLVKQKLTALIEKAQQQKALWLEARVESLLGTRLYRVADYEGGFLHLTKAVKLLEKQAPEVYPIKQTCLYLLANAHFTFKEYTIAAAYYQQAIAASSRHDRHYYTMHILNELAFCHRKLNQLDSSNYYFKRTLAQAIEKKDTLWQVLSKGNLGENYYLAGDFVKAEPLLLQDADYAISIQNHGAASNALALLGDIAMQQGQLPKAQRYLSQAHQFACLTGELRRLQLIYPLLAKLSAATFNPQKAAMYMDSAFFVNDSLDREFDYIKSVRADQQLEREETNAKLSKLEGERAVKIAERNALIALLLALAALSFLIFTKLQKRYLRNKKQLQNTTSALEAAQQQLQNFTDYLAEKNQQLETLQEQADENANHSLSELQEQIILTEEDWENFKLLFNQVHAGFLKRLAQKYPQLSQAEVRFIALSKMELSPKQMTAVLGVGDSTIRQVRSRLKRKLSLESNEALEHLISSI